MWISISLKLDTYILLSFRRWHQAYGDWRRVLAAVPLGFGNVVVGGVVAAVAAFDVVDGVVFHRAAPMARS